MRPLTIWTKQHEFFLEHEIPQAENPAGFALHITNLADGSPRTAGPLEMQFQLGKTKLQIHLQEPARPGIYLAEVQFPTVGNWKWTLQVDKDRPPLPEVVVYSTKDAVGQAGSSQADPAGSITMLKEQQWPARLKTETAEKKNLADRVPATARITACRTHTARISAPAAGTLQSPSQAQRVPLGKQVQAGETLAVLRIPLLAGDLGDWESGKIQRQDTMVRAKHEVSRGEAALQTAQANLRLEENAFTRIQTLHAQSAKSDRELEEARFQLVSAQASLGSAEETLGAWTRALASFESDKDAFLAQESRSMELKLLSPISGQVIHAPTAGGEWLNEGDLLFEIQDLSQLHVSIRVPETDLTRLGKFPRAHLPHPSNGSQVELPGLGGKLLLAAPKVHPVTHSAELLYEIPNPGWLRAGMTLRAHLATGPERSVLAVPPSALVDDAGLDVVFVQTAGESFSRRTVRTGAWNEDAVEILEGLQEGEMVVVDGAYIVLLVSLSGVIPEHSH